MNPNYRYMVRIRIGTRPFRILDEVFEGLTFDDVRETVKQRVLLPEVMRDSGRTVRIRIFHEGHLYTIDHVTEDASGSYDLTYSPNERHAAAKIRIPQWEKTKILVTDREMANIAEAISNDPRMKEFVGGLLMEYIKKKEYVS